MGEPPHGSNRICQDGVARALPACLRAGAQSNKRRQSVVDVHLTRLDST